MFESCHTAKIGRYLVMGDVPAADIRRLLQEKPEAIGLSMPGMLRVSRHETRQPSFL